MTEISYPPPFSPKIIQHAVWLYCAHVELSRRRGTARRAGARHLYETVRCWVLKFEFSVTSASRISACGTEEKIGLTREWSGYWGGGDHDAQ